MCTPWPSTRSRRASRTRIGTRTSRTRGDPPMTVAAVNLPEPERAGGLVVIDHHAHNSGLAGVQLIDASAAATAVIVEELVRRMGAAVDAETATLLYVGLVTDTGSFQHSVTTPAVHGVAARLLA